jgi:hypothetical protein
VGGAEALWGLQQLATATTHNVTHLASCSSTNFFLFCLKI